MDTENDATADSQKGTGRRDLLTKGAVAAAVAAVAGVAVSSRASAANGDTIVVGGTHTGTSLTTLTGSTFKVVNGATAVASVGTPSVHGSSTLTDGIGVLGEASGTAGVGVYGRTTATAGAGVEGRSTAASPGVLGINDGTWGGAAVIGVAAGTGADLQANGSGRVLVSKAGVANPPTSGALGTIARDDAGNLWYAVAADSWRKLAGPGTSGSFHPVNPSRVFDSRIAAYAPLNGVLARDTNRVVPVKDARDATGAVTTADIVPVGATAVAINVTVTGPTGPNYLSVTPGDAASFTASTINWPGGFDCANGAIVKLDASRQLKVFCGDQAGSTNVIIDVTGYYL